MKESKTAKGKERWRGRYRDEGREREGVDGGGESEGRCGGREGGKGREGKDAWDEVIA